MYTLALVEDDYHIRSGLSRFFPWESLGFQLVRSFENGKAALDYLLGKPVDVVLTDVRMPVMDGITLVRELKRAHPDTLAVFISAYRDFDYAYSAIELGVVRYIVKSTKYDDLIGIFTQIRELLDEREKDAPAPAPRKPDTDDPVIAKVTRLIEEDLAGVTLTRLADAVKLSPVYLSRYFKEKTDVNFVDYVIEKKMEKSLELLHGTADSIAKISETVGYSNEKNFARAFKKYYGISPSDYRHLP